MSCREKVGMLLPKMEWQSDTFNYLTFFPFLFASFTTPLYDHLGSFVFPLSFSNGQIWN